MSALTFFDRSGLPITFEAYLKLLDDRDYKRVAYGRLRGPKGEIEVSTVWLGLNHQWNPGGPPLIFETMVFGGPDDDDEQWRWSTEAGALAGHQRVVAQLLSDGFDFSRSEG